MNESTDDILRRLSRLEDSDDRMKEALQQLIVQTTRTGQLVEQLARLEPTVRELELKANNNGLILSAIKWLALTFVGSAMTILVTAYFKGLLL